ncbi:HAUS8 protein, partial [Amia calva]|nr:HAUS8 protein [Amia calva]
NTSINQSISVVPRPGTPTKLGAPNKPSSGTPTRRSMAPQSIATPFSMMSSMLEPSQPGINVLQSTILDGHCFRPEFDVSSINEKAVMENAADPEEVKEMLENQTFLLAYLTSKIENNTQRLREEAERCLLAVMEEEERLRSAVQEKKRQFLLREKERQLDDLLDLQIAVLTPVVAAADQFKQQYKAFATAVDTTRHELPVHNVQMEGDRKEFLGRAETCLRETECLLREAWVQPTAGDQERAGSLLKEVKETAQEIDKELARCVLLSCPAGVIGSSLKF